MRRRGFIVFCALALSACGGGAGSTIAPGTKDANAVQGAGMRQTFAGQNKCNAKNHDRPFIIEWDATDMSSFESRAASDVIVVRYEGCELQVLDGCVDDSVKGAFGSYRPVEWTSGSLESLDIENQADLYAKLPLGAATLGGRVEGGEKFHMEYFVSGTKTATRPALFRADVAKVPGCKGATHFVYGYNLGAFALGARSNLKGSIGGSAFGFGAGGSRSAASRADKAGGVVASCRGETAREAQTCRVPIRLTLREITDGESGDARASQAAETPEAQNLAGRLKAETEREKKAAAHLESARTKMTARDGKGCLSELDEHDKLDPRPTGLSSTPGWAGTMRAQCLMLAGQCGPGKALYRKSLEQGENARWGPELLDRQLETAVATYCEGQVSPREELLRAWSDLQVGSVTKKDVAYCESRYQTVKRLRPQVKPRDSQDYAVTAVTKGAADTIGGCFVKSGDCARAWEVWHLEEVGRIAEGKFPVTPGVDSAPRARFDNIHPACKR